MTSGSSRSTRRALAMPGTSSLPVWAKPDSSRISAFPASSRMQYPCHCPSSGVTHALGRRLLACRNEATQTPSSIFALVFHALAEQTNALAPPIGRGCARSLRARRCRRVATHRTILNVPEWRLCGRTWLPRIHWFRASRFPERSPVIPRNQFITLIALLFGCAGPWCARNLFHLDAGMIRRMCRDQPRQRSGGKPQP